MIKSYSNRQYYRSYFCSFIDKNFTNLYKIKQSSISTINVYQSIFLQHRRLMLFNKLHNAIEFHLYEQMNTNTQIRELIIKPLLSEISKVRIIESNFNYTTMRSYSEHNAIVRGIHNKKHF